MRDELAEALLAKVMNWSDEEKARERPILQDFARYKYDEYQQYAPGRRFRALPCGCGSFTLWKSDGSLMTFFAAG
jgi:hypothetical protein